MIAEIVAPIRPGDQLGQLVEVVLHLQADAHPATEGGNGQERRGVPGRGVGPAPACQ